MLHLTRPRESTMQPHEDYNSDGVGRMSSIPITLQQYLSTDGETKEPTAEEKIRKAFQQYDTECYFDSHYDTKQGIVRDLLAELFPKVDVSASVVTVPPA